MSLNFLISNVEFNISTFEENEANRWKFLDEMPATSNIGFFIRSPIPVITATICYILFVCVIGPIMMRKREPFQLKNLIRFYNLIMVLFAAILYINLYSAVDSMMAMMTPSKIFTFDDQTATKVYRMANLIIFVRLSEYLDTIFFTLRKKQNQITFLHVFHHAFVPIYAYWILRTAPVRFNVFIILINSFIHILMYFYYFLATFQTVRDEKKGTKVSFVMFIVNKLLMFKKYMTQMQILQFVALGLYTIYAAIQPDRCGIPWTYVIANFLLASGFLGLFLDFYIRSYRSSAAAKSRKD